MDLQVTTQDGIKLQHPRFLHHIHILHINSYKLIFLNDFLSRSSFFSYVFSGSVRSPSRRWNKSKLSFSTWTVSTWESSSWDVWNSRNWWYVWDIYIILYNYIEFISYLYLYIYIFIIYHHFPQIAIVGGTVVTPFLDALHKTTSVTECTNSKNWVRYLRYLRYTPGKMEILERDFRVHIKVHEQKVRPGSSGVRCVETRRKWVYEDIKLLVRPESIRKPLFFVAIIWKSWTEMARPEI
jgi:hypothetical protein